MIVAFAIFVTLVAYVALVVAAIGVADRIAFDVASVLRRRTDRALVDELAARDAGARADTLTCPRCRRVFPLVTFLGRTRCPECGVLVLGWQ